MKKSVKILALAMALVLVAAAFTACGGQKAPETSAPAAPAEDASAPASGDGGAAEKSYKVALVSDMAVDEAEWLQNLVAGLGDYQTEHPNIEVKVVEATQSSEYEPKTRALAQAGYNIIITTNSSMADATTAVARGFPGHPLRQPGRRDLGHRGLSQPAGIRPEPHRDRIPCRRGGRLRDQGE